PILAHHGVELREWPSAGAVENLQRLLNPKERVDVAFVQGGLGMLRKSLAHGGDCSEIGEPEGV
ncbi:MAG: hypothetical protein WCA12_01515, partial [Burkholderiales bacterium]